MRPLWTLATYITAVFFGGALLAPWLYFLAQHFASEFPKIANSPFHRYVDRALIIVALLGLWPFFKNLGATSPTDLGLVSPAGQWGKLGGGLWLGFVSLAAVAALALLCHARHFNQDLTGGKLAGKVFAAAGSAVVVAPLEEVLFRGALFGSLKRAFHWSVALAASSAVYALVHFLTSGAEPASVTWSSGLETLLKMLHNFTNWQAVIPGFFNLALAGAILTLSYQRTGNLYFSIGLHAGWIFWLKSYNFLLVPASGASYWCWGTGRLAVVNGWLALPVLGATLFVCTRLRAGRQK